LEPGLVDLLTRDVEREPGALPLLSHALRKAWERREGHTLTVSGYRESGGIRGAVAQSAEELYEQTPVEQRRVLRDLVLRLVAPSAEGEPVRARLPRRLVATNHEHELLVERLVAARLVTSDDGTIELAHEALTRAWPRLRGWLDDDVEGQRILRHLTIAADTWDGMARPDSELYRGVRLAQALDWRDRTCPHLTPAEQGFLDASRDAAVAERQTAEVRAHHQSRVNRRLRALLTGVALLLVVALVAGGIALDQRADAREQARVADSVRLAAQASAQPTEQRSLALLLALEARRLDTSDATDGALQATLAAVPPGVERLLPVGGLNGVAAVSPDHRLLAAPVDDGDIRLIDFATGRTLHVLHGSDAGLLNVTAFSPNGHLLVSGGRDGRIRLWDSRTGRLVGEPIDAGSGVVWGLFAPTDPATLFTVNSSSITRWDVSRPDHPVRVGGAFEFQEEPTEIVSVRTSLDGRRVAAGGWTARRAVVWDVETATRLGEYDGLPGAFTADGNSLVVAREDHLAFVDVNTGAEQGDRLTGLTTANPNLVTNVEGTRLAVADLTDSSIRVFDVTTRKQVGETLELFKGVSFPAAFLDRDRLVVAGGRSQQAAVWRFAEPTPPFATVLSGRTGRVDAYFTPDSEEIVTSGYEDTWADRWRASDGRHIGEVTIDGTRTGLPMLSRDGDVAVGRPDGSIDMFDTRSGRAISTFDTGQPAPRPSWSPDGSVLATVANDLSIVLWDVTDRRHPRERARLRVGTPADEQQIMAVFSPDGDLVAASHWRNAPVAFRDPGSAIIDVADGRILRKVDGGGLVAFSPDGRTLVTSNTGSADLVGLFDVATGERRWLRAFPTFVFGVTFADGGERVATVRYPGGVAFGSVTPTGPPIATAFAPAVIVELWDAATARPIGEPMIVRGYSPTPARANEDGTKLVNGTQNGVAILWDLDSGHWSDIACRIAGRNLTRAEWTQYLPDRTYAATCPEYRSA
jgi:WD40 repeat protein